MFCDVKLCNLRHLWTFRREEVVCFYPITFLPVNPPPATDEDQQGKRDTHVKQVQRYKANRLREVGCSYSQKKERRQFNGRARD